MSDGNGDGSLWLGGVVWHVSCGGYAYVAAFGTIPDGFLHGKTFR